MSEHCECAKILYRFFSNIHYHLKVKAEMGDMCLIDGSLEEIGHCNFCDKPRKKQNST